MRRSRAANPPPSPFRALAHHQAANNASGGGVNGSGQGKPGSSGESVSSLLRSFNVEANPARPIRPSPLAASAIPDIPLDLLDRIRSFPLFMSAPDDFVAAIGKHLRPQIHSAHENILTEGDDAVAMYWLVRGVVAVTSRDGEAVYAELTPGAFFGEIGVIMDVARTATVVARTKCLLVVLKKEALRAELPKYPDMEKAIRQEAQERLTILKKKRLERSTGAVGSPGANGLHHAREVTPGRVAVGESGALNHSLSVNPKKRKSPSPGVLDDPTMSGSALGSGFVNVRTTLKELPLFAELPADILHFLGLSAQPMSYPPFTDIICKGAPGNDLFFIVRGEVEILINDEPVFAANQLTMTPRPRLRQGQYFGEVASLGLSPGRTATVRSITSVECLMIGGDALKELWRRCPPGLRSQVEDTARRRFRNSSLGAAAPNIITSGEAHSYNGGPLTPTKVHTSQPLFPAVASALSPSKDEASSRLSADPDPFLNVDMEAMRNRRRSSLAPPISTSDGTPPPPPLLNGARSSAFDSNRLKQYPFSAPSSPPDRDWQGPKKKARIVPRRAYSNQPPRLPDDIMIMVFNHLDMYQLIRLRQVSSHWRRMLSESDKICRYVDLSPFHRCVTDQVIADVLAPFIKHRPRHIDISNSFHITDEGFRVLWKECGKNVICWRMRSVWEVSASHILEMSDNTKQLEEIDWSNCRKVGDNLLGRVVGWTVPYPPPERPRSVVIGRSGAVVPRQQGATPAAGSSPSQQHQQQQEQQQQQHQQPPPNVPAPGTIIGCPNLSRLNISYCKHITDRSMAHLAAHASSRLQHLSLTRCTSITDLGFQAWTAYPFPRLTHLCLADCTYLTDKAIVSLVSSAKNLTHLDLSFCCALSDTATEVIALGLPRLKELRLSFCGSAVSDASLGGIALHLNELQGLSVRGCVRVTGVGVESVLEGCGMLEWLDVSQCKNLGGWLHSDGVARWGYDDRLRREYLASLGRGKGMDDVVMGIGKEEGGHAAAAAAVSTTTKTKTYLPPPTPPRTFGIGRYGAPTQQYHHQQYQQSPPFMMKPGGIPRTMRSRRMMRKPVRFILEKGEGLR